MVNRSSSSPTPVGSPPPTRARFSLWTLASTFDSRPSVPLHSQTALLRALRLTAWAVPAAMVLIGVGFTLFEHLRHRTDPLWPWPTVLGLGVLGIAGPALSWLSLRWAIGTAEAYLKSEAELARRNDQLAALNTLAMAASSSLDLEKTIATALEQTMETLDAAAGMVFLQRDSQPGLRLEAHRGISVSMAQQEARLAPGHCLCGQAVKTRQVLFAGDVGKDPRCTSNLWHLRGLPLGGLRPAGSQGPTRRPAATGESQRGTLRRRATGFRGAMARQVSVSIENARLYDTVRVFNVELEQKINQRTRELESARWALAEKARQLQRLLSESYRIQEDTQARIAHDMHDGVTQMIIGALYETQAARQALPDDADRAAEILAARDNGLAPCQRVLDTITGRLGEIDHRIADLLTLREALKRLHREGATLPLDDVRGETCVCYLLKPYRDSAQVTIQKGEFFDD